MEATAETTTSPATRDYSCSHCWGSDIVLLGSENEHGEYTEIGVPCRRCRRHVESVTGKEGVH